MPLIHRGIAVFNLNTRRLTDFVQHLKNRIAFGEADLGLGQDRPILWNKGGLFFIQILRVVQDGITHNGNGADVILLTGFNQGIVFYLLNFVLASEAVTGVCFQCKSDCYTGNDDCGNDQYHDQVCGFLFHTDPLFMSSVAFIKDSIVDFCSGSRAFCFIFQVPLK